MLSLLILSTIVLESSSLHIASRYSNTNILSSSSKTNVNNGASMFHGGCDIGRHLLNRFSLSATTLNSAESVFGSGLKTEENTVALTEHLIGEEMVTDSTSASLLADRCMEEAYRLFSSTANWKKVDIGTNDILVETIPLSGPYAKSGVHLVRGVGIIPASAEKFFEFQISREGFQSIDEYLVNHRNVDNFKWETRPEFDSESFTLPAKGEYFPENAPYQLMMNRVEWKYPIKRREFVALDVVHKKDMILISKSSLSPHRPGGSRYQSEVPLDENTPYCDPVDPVKRSLVRAVQYYASKVDPIDENSCKLTMVTWGEMCDSYSSWWVNLFNAHVFITPKFDRFRRVMGGERVFEESKIMDNAWRLLSIIPNLKPDAVNAAKSDFVVGKKVV